MSWTLIFFEGARPHLCHDSLVDALVADMMARGHAEVTRHSSHDSIGIDRGGMVMSDRPVERWQWANADFGVPSEHVAHFASQLAELPRREFADGRGYCKLHTRFSALTMTPEHRDELLSLMRASAHDAEARASLFYKGTT